MWFRKKYEGVVEAVRYNPDGMLALVRAYERMGAAFTDHILLSREDLRKQIKSGKRFMIGQRKPYLAGSFEVSAEVRLTEKPGKEWFYTGSPMAGRDDLQGAPLF